jgi:hypothetical protein
VSKSKTPTDDALAEAEGTVAAARRFAEWKAANEDRLDALILTYNDQSAARLLEVLRELFWSER